MKAPFLGRYRTDKSTIENGAWVSGFANGAEFKIRSVKSQVYKKAQKEIDERNRPFLRLGQAIPEAIQEQNAVDATCALVADWRGGVVDDNGQSIPYSPEAARSSQLFGDPELWELRDLIIGLAATAETFRKAELEDTAKNSEKPVSLPLDSADAATK